MHQLAMFVFVLSLVVPKAIAANVPGTPISISPPAGFVAADRFPGFMNDNTNSSIMISEIPSPFSEIAAGFNDRKRLHAQGMVLLNQSLVEVDGRNGLLLHVEQAAYGMLFRKWMVAVDRAGTTILIVATYPETEAMQGDLLKQAVLAARVGKATDPAEALAFTAKPSPPFAVARVFGQNMILTPQGQLPVKVEHVPFMVLGLSASEGLAIPDRKAFAERRVTKIAKISNIEMTRSSPVKIGNLSGIAITAKGEGEDSATPLAIYQVVLFDASGYCLFQGIAPAAEKDLYLPLFEQTAASFRMKSKRQPGTGS
jgi:hypothetical protein